MSSATAAPARRCSETKSTLREMGWLDKKTQRCTVIMPDELPCGALYSAHRDASETAASAAAASSASDPAAGAVPSLDLVSALRLVASTLSVRPRESHPVLVRAWNAGHQIAAAAAAAAVTASSAMMDAPAPVSLRVVSYADLREKVGAAFFSSAALIAQPGAADCSDLSLVQQLAHLTVAASGMFAAAASPVATVLPVPRPQLPPFVLYYLTDSERWWESRVKVDNEASFEVYVSRPLYIRPMLLLWFPPHDCHAPTCAAQQLPAEHHRHSPLKDAAPVALPSLVPYPTAASSIIPSPTKSSGSGSSRSSAQQTDFAEAVRRRDDDCCVVCAAQQVEAAHVVPVKDDRTAAGFEQSGLLSLYDPRNGITLCTLCHDFFDAGHWCILTTGDRDTLVVSAALLAHQPEWKQRTRLRLPSHHADHWPSALTLQVQVEFFDASKLKRAHQRLHFPFSCGKCGNRFMTRTGLTHHGRYCVGRGQLKPSQLHTPDVRNMQHSSRKSHSSDASSRKSRRRTAANGTQGSPTRPTALDAVFAAVEEEDEASAHIPPAAAATAGSALTKLK